MNENENKNKELENQGDTIPPLQMSEEPIISDIAPELKEAIMPTNEPVQETTTEAQQVPPAPAPSPAARKSRKSHPVLISLLICLTIMVASVCAVICLALLGGGIGRTTVIYENGTWENKGEIVSDEAIVNAAAQTSPSVVAIVTESVSYNAFYGNFVTEGAGSGVICTEDGYIITNHHVVNGATNIHVTLENGDTHAATLVGSDAQSDLAVIKIEATGLKPAVYAAAGSLSVGQTVIAIGNPLGTLSNTVTSGVVSALARQITISGSTMTLLQHNASVNPGNSGGGLFNLNGELVGIVNAKSSGESVEGIGFAIPVETFKKIVQELIEIGYVTGRPQIGISAYEVLDVQAIYSLPEDIRACLKGFNYATGVYIGNDDNVQYAKGSQTLMPGDLVISMDEQLVKEFADFSMLLSGKEVGDTVSMIVYRYNKETGKTSQVHVSIILTEKKQ